METIIFSTIYSSSAVISLHYLHLYGTFPSDMLSLHWAAPGVPPLYRTASSCWILKGVERSFIPPSNCPYILTVPRKVGAAGPKPYNADTAKVRKASSHWSKSIYFVPIQSCTVGQASRTRVFLTGTQDWFSPSQWKRCFIWQTTQRFDIYHLIRSEHMCWFALKSYIIQPVYSISFW